MTENGTTSRAGKSHEGSWCATCFALGMFISAFVFSIAVVIAG